MVVARDRYLAEDAAQRIRVTYEQLPVVVGIDNARSAAQRWCTTTCPATSAPTCCRRSATSRPPWPPPRTGSPSTWPSSAARAPRWRARASTPSGTSTRARCACTPPPRPPTGVRAAVAAKLGMPLAKVECIAPDVGGGFGVKIVHPWPEEVLVPWAARNLGREVKWTEDRREHFISSAHERGQLQEVTVGFDDEGRLLALDVRFWHDNGAYTPYGIIVPIITATQLLGPYKPRRLPRRVLVALHQHRSRDAVSGRRPPAGLLRHGARDGCDRGAPRPRPRRGALAQLHPARRDALRPRPDVPGRPAAEVRLRRLPGIPGQAQGAGRLGRLRRLPRAGRGARAAGWAWASAATSRAPASAPTRAATCTSRPAGGSTSPPA